MHPGELVVPLQMVTDNFAPAWRETNTVRKSIDDPLEEEWNETKATGYEFASWKLDGNKHVLITTLPAFCVRRL